MRVCLYLLVCLLFMCVCLYVYICVFVCVYTCTCLCIYVYMYGCIRVCMCGWIRVCMYYIQICTYGIIAYDGIFFHTAELGVGWLNKMTWISAATIAVVWCFRKDSCAALSRYFRGPFNSSSAKPKIEPLLPDLELYHGRRILMPLFSDGGLSVLHCFCKWRRPRSIRRHTQ